MKKEPLTCLIDTCHLVSSSLDIDSVLKGVTKISKDVLKAEAGSLMLIDGQDNKLNFAVALGRKGNKLKKNVSLKLGQGVAGWVAKEGKPQVVKDVKKDKRFYKQADKTTGFVTRSILAVPLKTKDKTIGVLEVINPVNKIHFDETDIPMFQAFACQIAVAIENARMHKKMLEQQKTEQELDIAKKIQENILPAKYLLKNNIFITAEYKPAKQIGGDFFDIIDLDDRIIIAIGDVSGKGIPAALYMVRLITRLRSLAPLYANTKDLTFHLNNILTQRSTLGMFATAIIVSINKLSKEISVTNAGHPDPLIIKGNKIGHFKMHKGFPLGIIPEKIYPSEIIKNNVCFFLYTDGIIEARNKTGSEFGLKKLETTLKNLMNYLVQPLHAGAGSKLSKNNLLTKLFSSVRDYSKNTPQHDDLTAVLVNIT